jgi:hypothetical protein
LNRSEAWKTWAIVIGLLIFTGLASAAWLWLSNQDDAGSTAEIESVQKETEPITISVGDYVLGNELLGIDFINDNIEGFQIDPWLVFVISLGVVTLIVGGIGIGITLITVITSRQVSKAYEDKGFRESQVKLTEQDAAVTKARQETRPVASPEVAERRLRWSVVTTSLLIIILVWITGLIFGVAYFGDTTWEIAGQSVSAVTLINLILILLTIIVLALIIRAREPGDLDSSKTDYNPVNWSYVWIIVTGALIVGIGAGLAFAMRLL